MTKHWLITPHPTTSIEEIRVRTQEAWDQFSWSNVWKRSTVVKSLKSRVASAAVSKRTWQICEHRHCHRQRASTGQPRGRIIATAVHRLFIAQPMPGSADADHASAGTAGRLSPRCRLSGAAPSETRRPHVGALIRRILRQAPSNHGDANSLATRAQRVGPVPDPRRTSAGDAHAAIHIDPLGAPERLGYIPLLGRRAPRHVDAGVRVPKALLGPIGQATYASASAAVARCFRNLAAATSRERPSTCLPRLSARTRRSGESAGARAVNLRLTACWALAARQASGRPE